MTPAERIRAAAQTYMHDADAFRHDPTLRADADADMWARVYTEAANCLRKIAREIESEATE